jgi:hypothetical protein
MRAIHCAAAVELHHFDGGAAAEGDAAAVGELRGVAGGGDVEAERDVRCGSAGGRHHAAQVELLQHARYQCDRAPGVTVSKGSRYFQQYVAAGAVVEGRRGEAAAGEGPEARGEGDDTADIDAEGERLLSTARADIEIPVGDRGNLELLGRGGEVVGLDTHHAGNRALRCHHHDFGADAEAAARAADALDARNPSSRTRR